MKTARKLLDGARLKRQCSDYELASVLAVPRSLISEIRHGRKKMPDWMAVSLAQIAGMDPASALVELHWNQSDDATKSAWALAVRRVGPVMLAIGIGLGSGFAYANANAYYVKRKSAA